MDIKMGEISYTRVLLASLSIIVCIAAFYFVGRFLLNLFITKKIIPYPQRLFKLIDAYPLNTTTRLVAVSFRQKELIILLGQGFGQIVELKEKAQKEVEVDEKAA